MTVCEYKRDLQHNYLILSTEETEKESFWRKMLERNTIQSILPCSIRYMDGSIKYYYEISSKQPLAAAFAVHKMDYGTLNRLFAQLGTAMRELENYLLDSRQVMLDMRYLYWDMKEERLYLVLCPEPENDQKKWIQRFAEELLDLADYTDKRAVDAVYAFYQRAMTGEAAWMEVSGYIGSWKETEAEPMNAEQPDEKQPETGLDKAEMQEEIPEEILYDAYNSESAGEGKKTEKIKKAGRKAGVLCAVTGLTTAVCLYIWNNYELTETEMLTGGGFLAMGLTMLCLWIIRQKRQGGKPGDETEKALNLPEEQKECSLKKEISEQAERKEAEEIYGETVYFPGEEEERCLEGRVHGNMLTISLDRLPFLIGKQEGAVNYVLSDITVSRIHARFLEQDGKMFLQDMNSRNGTLKNGVGLEAQEMAEVRPGDEIQFGRLRFTYH